MSRKSRGERVTWVSRRVEPRINTARHRAGGERTRPPPAPPPSRLRECGAPGVRSDRPQGPCGSAGLPAAVSACAPPGGFPRPAKRPSGPAGWAGWGRGAVGGQRGDNPIATVPLSLSLLRSLLAGKCGWVGGLWGWWGWGPGRRGFGKLWGLILFPKWYRLFFYLGSVVGQTGLLPQVLGSHPQCSM